MRIICLASNGYINCIEPFAHYWNCFAGTLRRVTVACYDTQPRNLPDNFDVLSIGEQADYTWSTGLARLLDLLDDDVILLVLEDYFLTGISWTHIEELYQLFMYPSVVKIDLSDDRQKAQYVEHGIYGHSVLIESPPDAPFQASLQAALWRTKFLYSLLEPAENAWQFEKNGTKRLIARRAQGGTEQVLGTLNTPVMTYANAVGGAGGKPGVIEPKHMPAWMYQECVEKGWAR